ncbi:MAG TPA: vWA domain-containing protein [Polyangiaceae bacterium]|nr:vWA domain-containing protein [Polyangiaceae bacterium]
MRLVQVAPVFFGTLIALACGSNVDESKVAGGSASNGNINPGNTAGSGIGDINTGSGNGTGNSNGGSSSVDQNSACTQTSADGQPTQVDLYFMVDITGSMNCPVPDGGVMCDMAQGPPTSGDSRWTVVSAALKAFIADPANQTLGVGLRFFPIAGSMGGPGGGGAACNASSYATPNVEIGPLSMTAQPLTAAIDMQMPNGSTPTVPSLTAALSHATAWAQAHPTHRVAVVYATDGQPNGCGNTNTVDQAAATALRAALGTPSIPTYVLGVGPSLANLNSIAENGGTKSAFLVDTSGNAAQQLSAALATIRATSALDCTYTVPTPPSGQALEPGKVNVEYTNSAGMVTKILQDPAGTSCDAGSGWQYSADGKQINLCGKACTDVKADKGGKLQVLFGCSTQVGIPK